MRSWSGKPRRAYRRNLSGRTPLVNHLGGHLAADVYDHGPFRNPVACWSSAATPPAARAIALFTTAWTAAPDDLPGETYEQGGPPAGPGRYIGMTTADVASAFRVGRRWRAEPPGPVRAAREPQLLSTLFPSPGSGMSRLELAEALRAATGLTLTDSPTAVVHRQRGAMITPSRPTWWPPEQRPRGRPTLDCHRTARSHDGIRRITADLPLRRLIDAGDFGTPEAAQPAPLSGPTGRDRVRRGEHRQPVRHDRRRYRAEGRRHPARTGTPSWCSTPSSRSTAFTATADRRSAVVQATRTDCLAAHRRRRPLRRPFYATRTVDISTELDRHCVEMVGDVSDHLLIDPIRHSTTDPNRRVNAIPSGEDISNSTIPATTIPVCVFLLPGSEPDELQGRRTGIRASTPHREPVWSVVNPAPPPAGVGIANTAAPAWLPR